MLDLRIDIFDTSIVDEIADGFLSDY